MTATAQALATVALAADAASQKLATDLVALDVSDHMPYILLFL